MNNYLIFDKILKCSVVDDTAKHELIFKRWKRKFKFHDKYQNYIQEKNKMKTSDEVKLNLKTMLEKEDQKRKKLAEIGINYEFPGFVYKYILFFRKLY
jgi:nucleolar protein 15